MDYIIADRLVIPERDLCWYSEQVVYLPDVTNRMTAKNRRAERAPTRSENGLPATGSCFAASTTP
jgi:predicted O-linked N-acetylglucosamine transferase (SPINDLY family)